MENKPSFITQEIYDTLKEGVLKVQKDALLKLFESIGISMEEAGVTEKEIDEALCSYSESESFEKLNPLILKAISSFAEQNRTNAAGQSVTPTAVLAKDIGAIISFASLDIVLERMSGSK